MGNRYLRLSGRSARGWQRLAGSLAGFRGGFAAGELLPG